MQSIFVHNICKYLLKKLPAKAIYDLHYLYEFGQECMAIGSVIYPITNGLKTLYNRIPSKIISKNSVINSVEHIGRKWTSPQQRLIMGATAVLMQPAIDARNKRVDEDTKNVSVAKTLSKIIIGTLTGVIIRSLSIKAVKAFSVPFDALPKDIKPLEKKLKTFLSSTKLKSEMTDELAQYRNAMGTIVSLFIMLFTNFAIDAPFTNKLTNYLIGNEKTNTKIKSFVMRNSKQKGEDK